MRVSRSQAEAWGVLPRKPGNGRGKKTRAGGSRKTTLPGRVLKELTRLGIWAFRCQSGKVKLAPEHGGGWMNLAPEGTPDIIGLVVTRIGAMGGNEPLCIGRLLAIECKEGSGRLTRTQARTIDNINRKGGLAFVARHEADVYTALRAEGVI